MQAQDVRLTATRVADLLAQMPARDNGYTEKLMNGMLALGDAGTRQICDQVSNWSAACNNSAGCANPVSKIDSSRGRTFAESSSKM